MTIRDAYLMGCEHLAAGGSAEPSIEAEVLLRHALAVDRATMYTRWEQTIPEDTWRRYRELLELRASGRPVHYIIGEREFMGLRFSVDERVMIPRPETEVLVEYVVHTFRKQGSGFVADTQTRRHAETRPQKGNHERPSTIDDRQLLLVDVGTGSGCIAVSLARYLPQARVYAVDISAGALEVAQANADRHGVSNRLVFLEGDLLAALPAHLARSYDAIVSNPPYVPQSQRPTLPREIREYEPATAILAPGDGLGIHRRLIGESPQWLQPSGLLVMEVGSDQAPEVVTILRRDGRYREVRTLKDASRIERVVVGTLA